MWLVVIVAIGVALGLAAGWLWGVLAAVVTLIVSEVVERSRRARTRRERGVTAQHGVRDVVGDVVRSRRRR